MTNSNISSSRLLPEAVRIGIMGTLVVLLLAGAVALAVTTLAGTEFFVNELGTFLMCATPFQIVMAIIWGNRLPPLLAELSQPLKGVAVTVCVLLAGAVVMPILIFTVGQGVLTPILIHYVIQSVGITLLVLIVFNGWPVTAISAGKLAQGLGILVYCYLLNYFLFSAFYNYEFFKEAPFYSASLDPSGLFNGITALTFAVTAIAFIMLFAMFDGWPVSVLLKVNSQPVSGIVGTGIIIMLTLVSYYFCVVTLGLDPMRFMVQGPVSIIFGVFLVDNMMQFSLFSQLKQPFKGLVKTLLCLTCAALMYSLYAAVLPLIVGHELGAGPQARYAQEIWIATAMLGVTFPIINFVSGAFDFWPIQKK